MSLLGDQDQVLLCLVLKLGCLRPVWVPATSLCVWKSISCLLSLIQKICLSFLLLLLGSVPGESWVVWVDSARHCMSPHLQQAPIFHEEAGPHASIFFESEAVDSNDDLLLDPADTPPQERNTPDSLEAPSPDPPASSPASPTPPPTRPSHIR